MKQDFPLNSAKGCHTPLALPSRNDTRGLLHEAGFHYALDRATDDRPVWLRAKGAAVWITDTDRIAAVRRNLDAGSPGPSSCGAR